MFYEKLNINGTEFPLAVNIKGAGAPTASTAAEVGMFYMDTTTGDVYKCTAVSGSTYAWVALSDSASFRLNNDIPGTDQTISFDGSGRVSSVTHTDGSGAVVRTDNFTYSNTTITEVRTLSSGATLTFVFHKDTLKVEVK